MGLLVHTWTPYKPWWGFGRITKWYHHVHKPTSPKHASIIAQRFRELGSGARIEYDGKIVTVTDSGKLKMKIF